MLWKLIHNCLPVTYVKRLAHLFQTLALESCMADELAWKRARSVSTGELMKRGRGRRNDPIMHKFWSLKLSILKKIIE